MVRVIIYKSIYESEVTYQLVIYHDRDGSIIEFKHYHNINSIPSYLRKLKEIYKRQVTFISNSREIHEHCKKVGYSILTTTPYKEKME